MENLISFSQASCCFEQQEWNLEDFLKQSERELFFLVILQRLYLIFPITHTSSSTPSSGSFVAIGQENFGQSDIDQICVIIFAAPEKQC